jgi:hypothetical protein
MMISVVQRQGRRPRRFRAEVAEVYRQSRAVAAREVSRFARNSRDWQGSSMCLVVDTKIESGNSLACPAAGQ